MQVDDRIPARWFTRGRTRRCRLIVIHATQSPERVGAARAVAHDFATRPATNKASAHVTADALETIESVAPGNTAFAVPGANADGYHVEQVGYSEQSVEDWTDPYSLAVIRATAGVIRDASTELRIPRVWLDDAALAAYKAGTRDGGVTDHATCSRVLGGSHWDPGPYYPRALLMALVRLDPLPAPTRGKDMATDSNWVQRTDPETGDPAPELWVVTAGTDRAVWARVFAKARGTWGDWFSIGGTVPEGGDVSVAGGPDGQVDVTVTGTDAHLWHRACLADGTWLDWENLGGLAG